MVSDAAKAKADAKAAKKAAKLEGKMAKSGVSACEQVGATRVSFGGRIVAVNPRCTMHASMMHLKVFVA